jgi:hypothetical protein
MKKRLRNTLITAITGLAILAGSKIYSIINPERSPAYQYAISQGLTKEIAKELELRLKPLRLKPVELEANDKGFINAISSYDLELQKKCIKSDILDNKNISNAELKNVLEKKLNKAGTQIENPEEIYAILVNGSANSVGRYSRENAINSVQKMLLNYKLFKEEGVDEDNIFLISANADLFETERKKSSLEKKALLGTEDNFLKAIKNLHLDSNDSGYLGIFIPSTIKPEKKLRNSYPQTKRNYIEMGGEMIRPSEIGFSIREIKSYKKIIILQDSKEDNVLPYLDINPFTASSDLTPMQKRDFSLKKVLGISSQTREGLENENFTRELVKEYWKNKNQSIKELAEKVRAQVYYFDYGEKSPEESPDFYKPLFPIKE